MDLSDGMELFEFIIVLDFDGDITMDERHANKIYDAGCSDGTVMVTDSKNYVHFARYAKTWTEAVSSASENIQAAGYKIKEVKLESKVCL